MAQKYAFDPELHIDLSVFLLHQDWTTVEFFRYRLGPLLGGKSEGEAPAHGRGSIVANFKAVFFPSAAYHAEMGYQHAHIK